MGVGQYVGNIFVGLSIGVGVGFLIRILLKNEKQNNENKFRGNFGGFLPMSNKLKQSLIINYAKQYNIDILIETGTYKGDTLKACSNTFKKLYSVELDKNLYEKAKIKFNNVEKIKYFIEIVGK